MHKGLFITFEGPDGSGKSTQIAYLREFLDSMGLECVFTREPGGTKIGEKLREIILDVNNGEMADMTEAFLYAASRAQHVEELIKPAIEAGKIVICDRFIDSSIAYQGYGRNLGDSVRVINEYAVGECMPDITFLMQISPAVGMSRIGSAGMEQDRLEREKIEFHERVYHGYNEIAKMYGERFVTVDASGDREAIRDEILRSISEILEDRGIVCR